MTAQPSRPIGEPAPVDTPTSVPEGGPDLREPAAEPGRTEAPADDPEALREEIDRTREELEEAVDELAERVTSGARAAIGPLAIAAALVTGLVIVLAVRRRRRRPRRRRR